MIRFGQILIFYGLGSVLLNVFGWDFRLVSWVDMWGQETGWAIRTGVIVLGFMLFYFWPQEECETE